MNRATYIETFREKKTASFRVYCTPGDKKMFEEFFGGNELSRAARNALRELVQRGGKKKAARLL